MGPISDILHWGSPWWVSFDFSVDASGGVDLVIPRDTTVRGPDYSPTNSGSHNEINDYRLVLLGYHYDVVVAASAGFDLVWADHAWSPGGETQQYIIRPRNGSAAAADRLEGGTSFCFIVGPGGNTSPRNAADLQVIESASGGVTSGRLVCWGIEIDANLKWFKKYTGSPVDMGA